MYKYFPYKRMNHHEILLYGFHFSFFLIFTLAVIRDLLFNNYFNASVNFTSLTFSIISYYFLHYKHKNNLSSKIVIAIAVVPLYILIYFNHFGNMVIIYVILLPLAAFFLLKLKEALFVNFFMYLLLISMLYYISSINPTLPILSNPLALINISFASIFITFFGIFYHLAIDSSLSALVSSNRQKDMLLKEVHHRVKNNLNVIASILGLQSMGKSQETKDELYISKSRIDAIAIVHEMLYKQDDFEKIIFSEYINKLKSLIMSMHMVDNNVNIEIVNKDNSVLPLNIMIQFGLMINEMLTNSLKHVKNIDGLKILISLEKNGDKFLFIYKDNGKNELLEEMLDKSSGLGIKLIKLSVKQFDGEMKRYYENGLCYEVRFKNG